MGQHGALGQAGGAAGILQQRDVVGADVRPLRRLCCAIGELAEGDDGRIVRQGCLLGADLAPAIVLTNDQAIDQSLVEKLQRGRQQRREIARHQHPCAGIAELVRQRDFAIER